MARGRSPRSGSSMPSGPGSPTGISPPPGDRHSGFAIYRTQLAWLPATLAAACECACQAFRVVLLSRISWVIGIASGKLARFPDFFAGPLPSPCESGERMRGGGAGQGPQFQQILHLHAAPAQEPYQVAVAEMELHRVVIWPFEPVHAEIGAQQPVGGRQPILVGDGEHEQD